MLSICTMYFTYSYKCIDDKMYSYDNFMIFPNDTNLFYIQIVRVQISMQVTKQSG